MSSGDPIHFAGPPSVIEEMEEWLSSQDFDSSWRDCYEFATRGATGRSDRNISESVLFQTCASLHKHLPQGVLENMIPKPDEEFIKGALEIIGAECTRRGGLKDLEHFEAAIVVVYTHLAHCADTLEQQHPGIADAIMRGRIDPFA
eukprot:TRINITY_DN51441_c0_g1_i1.p1 TRINITY_DN51441_c0_g1~~TRINITY_DN51441_c0_g1_i1.p1  ORF type:complete len:146 (+),score=25.65 TRINITY_DN51441_c0_g1_i1:72-509(+)